MHYQMARLELAMGNRARALVELDTATRVDPQNPEILRTLAELARDDGQLERAEKSYRALLVVLRRQRGRGRVAQRSRGARCCSSSARSRERHGESERAREILESALEAAAPERVRAGAPRDGAARARRRRDARARARGEARAAGRLAGRREGARRAGRRPRRSPGSARAGAARPAAGRRPRPAVDARRTTRRSPSRGAVGGVERYVDEASALVAPAHRRGRRPLACALLARLGGVAEADLRRRSAGGRALRARGRPRAAVARGPPGARSRVRAASATPTSRPACSRCASRSRRAKADRARRATRSTGWPRCASRRARRSTRASR